MSTSSRLPGILLPGGAEFGKFQWFNIEYGVSYSFKPSYNISDSKFITGQVKRIKPQNGYRQSWIVPNFVNDCSRIVGTDQNVECLKVNDKAHQQNHIQLVTKVLQLSKR